MVQLLKAPEEERQIPSLTPRGLGIALPPTLPVILRAPLKEATRPHRPSRHPLGESSKKQQRVLSQKSRERPHWISVCHVPKPEPITVREEAHAPSQGCDADWRKQKPTLTHSTTRCAEIRSLRVLERWLLEVGA